MNKDAFSMSDIHRRMGRPLRQLIQLFSNTLSIEESKNNIDKFVKVR